MNVLPFKTDRTLFWKISSSRFTKRKSKSSKKLMKMKQGILQSQDCFTAHQSLIINLQEEVLIPVAMTPQQLIWLFLKKVVIHVFKSNQRESTAVEMVDTEQDINIDNMNDSGNMEVCLVCLFVCFFTWLCLSLFRNCAFW